MKSAIKKNINVVINKFTMDIIITGVRVFRIKKVIAFFLIKIIIFILNPLNVKIKIRNK